MKIIAKQSILTTFSSYLGVLIGYFNVLWLLPYVLDPGQLGLFRTVQDLALILVPFAQLGIGNGITRFYPRIKEQQFSFFTMSLLMSLLGALLVALLFVGLRDYLVQAFAANSPEVIDFFGVVLLVMLFSVLNSILDAFSRSFLEIAVPTFFREVFLRILVSLITLAYFIQWIDFAQLIWSLSAIYLLTLLGMAIYMGKMGIFKLEFSFNAFPIGFRREFIKYNLITFLGTTGSLLIMKIDSLMVAAMIGLDANAVYSIGFAIAIVIEMPRRAVSQVVMPVIAAYFEENQLEKINTLYRQVAVHQLLICLLLFIGIWANVNNLYHFIPNKEVYETGKWVVFWIGLGKIVDVLFSINGEIIVYSRYYVFNITATLIMSVLVITMNLLLIPQYGIEGAAIASLIAMVGYNLIKYLYVKIRLKLDPFSLDILKITSLGLSVYGLQHFLMIWSPTGFIDLIIRTVMISSLYILGIYGLKIAPQSQRDLIKKIKELRP
jgi:O-antigen/teichoic acid export membrane protein